MPETSSEETVEKTFQEKIAYILNCQVLGAPSNASLEEIKSAFRKKALATHPDRNPNDEAAGKKFRKVVEAYSFLTNPERATLGQIFRQLLLEASGLEPEEKIISEFDQIISDALQDTMLPVNFAKHLERLEQFGINFGYFVTRKIEELIEIFLEIQLELLIEWSENEDITFKSISASFGEIILIAGEYDFDTSDFISKIVKIYKGRITDPRDHPSV
jgi:curved DNA-binding protein CbpA